jgi:hypothetical protein
LELPRWAFKLGNDSTEGAMMNQDPAAPDTSLTQHLRMISTSNESLKLKLQANSLYLPALLKDPSTLQDISHNNQNLLIDSGATKSFVDKQEAKRLQLPMEKLNQSIWVTLIDGNNSIAGLITHTTTLQLLFEDGTEQIEKFYLTKIDEEHPWVLGYDWLRRCNPEINWSEPSIILDRDHEKARAIRLFETRDQASNCSDNISNKENSNFQDTEDQIRWISDRKRKKGVPLFGTTTVKEPIGKKITPLHETKDFVQNLRAQEFLKLVNEKDLPVTLFHIRAANAEKGAKSNSGGYEACLSSNVSTSSSIMETCLKVIQYWVSICASSLAVTVPPLFQNGSSLCALSAAAEAVLHRVWTYNWIAPMTLTWQTLVCLTIEHILQIL